MSSSRLEVEASTAFAGNNFLFFLPVYVGPFDIRVWAQRKRADGFGIEELFHVSVFENGRPVNLAEDSRFAYVPPSVDGDVTFEKRTDAEGYLQSLHALYHPANECCSEEDPLHLVADTTEAQNQYWSLVGFADEATELSHWDSLGGPVGQLYW